MTKKIRHSGPTYKRIVDTGPTLRRLDPSEVAAALGAEPTDVTLEGALSPLTLMVVRQELFRRLQSSGGRPALKGTTRRAKIPISDADWLELEKLAAAISSPGCAPTAGQVASVLLKLSLHKLAAEVSQSSKKARSPVTKELAALAASEATQTPSSR
jgi:hypothetical protein